MAYLPVVRMLPEFVEQELRQVVSEGAPTLDELERIILMLAHRLDKISNKDTQRHQKISKRTFTRYRQLIAKGG